MIHFAWPLMVLALPLPWLAMRLLPPMRPDGGALFLPFAADVADGAASSAMAQPRWRSLLYVAIWALLVAAAMRPQWLGEPVPQPTTGRRVLLAVDVSGSMATEDMDEGKTRLQVVQKVAGEFIRERNGDQLGLILFGTRPYLQAPLTSDLETVRHFLVEAVVGIAGTQTAIGDAIGLALKRLRDEPADGEDTRPDAHRQTVLILLTDGENDAGAMPPLQAAKLAQQAGLRIYTIGVGGRPRTDFFGNSIGGGLDEDTLQKIAQATGGGYFRATNALKLEQVYKRIDQLEPAAGRDQWYRPRSEWFHWPLGLALLLSVPASLLRGRQWSRT
ncbi:VWA domain-containing protein [Hydrocarboniphaga sp.]|uniref:VWA domain-containing protein n=1 Tax=Hydrocarboniphaga sp. TaxID=2033016 RepID=UPI003D11353A